jgi:hypothetical protein
MRSLAVAPWAVASGHWRGLGDPPHPDPLEGALPYDVDELVAMAASPQADVLLGRRVVGQEDDHATRVERAQSLGQADDRKRAEQSPRILHDLLRHQGSSLGHGLREPRRSLDQ